MSLSKQDIQRLDEQLDGATPGADAAFADAAQPILAERNLRAAYFAAMEPADEQAEQLAARIVTAARRQRPVGTRQPWFRLGAGAAACFAIGLSVGWMVHGRSAAVPIAVSPASSPVISVGENSTSAKVAAVTLYEVQLTDEAGRITAVQRFDSLQKANEFAHDVSNWQQRQQQLKDGAAVVVADRF